MCESMAPRGPDGRGIVSRGRVALGHRRLRIIDLSNARRAADGGPRARPDHRLQRLHLQLSGAARRARGARATASSPPATPRSSSRPGTPGASDCVERFHGMFAFVDPRARQRPRRAGARPVRHQAALPAPRRQARLRFASSLPALLAAGDVDTSIDRVALHHYMTLPRRGAAAAHHPQRRAQAAAGDDPRHRAGRQRTRTASTGSPPSSAIGADARRRAEDWRDAVLAALRAAVERRMVADVPVGVLLSGGVDSSLIVGLLAEAGQTGPA